MYHIRVKTWQRCIKHAAEHRFEIIGLNSRVFMEAFDDMLGCNQNVLILFDVLISISNVLCETKFNRLTSTSFKYWPFDLKLLLVLTWIPNGNFIISADVRYGIQSMSGRGVISLLPGSFGGFCNKGISLSLSDIFKDNWLKIVFDLAKKNYLGLPSSSKFDKDL